MPSWVAKKSPYPVPETLDRLERALVAAGCTVMARVDHSGHAAKAGLQLRPTQVLLFGKPSLGTQLMQAEQTVAIDLPSKALAWQDAAGQIWLGYRDLRVVAAQHPALGQAHPVAAELADLVDRATDDAVASSGSST